MTATLREHRTLARVLRVVALACPVLTTCVVTLGASAQLPEATTAPLSQPLTGLLLPLGPANPASTAWQARLQATPLAATSALADVDQWQQRIAHDPQTIARADVAELSAVQQHLTLARGFAAQLDEAAALRELTQAERRLGNMLHVPGAGVLVAEVQTAMGLVAAQAGADRLAEAALRRAAVIDPTRGVRAAETTPSWLERAQAIASQVATAPVGEVAITTNVSGAQVYLDEALQGVAPITVRGVRGMHLLRIEAPGYRALGSWLPLDSGARPAVHVELTRDPIWVLLDALRAAAIDRDRQRVVTLLGEAQAAAAQFSSAWLLQAGRARQGRALLTRCSSSGCDEALRLELDENDAQAAGYGQVLDPAGLGRDRTARDQAWVNAPLPMRAATPITAEAPRWWQRWYVWTAAAVIAGVGIGSVAAASAQDPEPRLRVTVVP